MKVFITDAAIRDLVAIADYIRPHNPDRASTFVDELLDHCEALAEFPQRYPLVPRYEHHGIRRCVHANYLIFYRVGTQQIDVIHILNGAQDYEALLADLVGPTGQNPRIRVPLSDGAGQRLR